MRLTRQRQEVWALLSSLASVLAEPRPGFRAPTSDSCPAEVSFMRSRDVHNYCQHPSTANHGHSDANHWLGSPLPLKQLTLAENALVPTDSVEEPLIFTFGRHHQAISVLNRIHINM